MEDAGDDHGADQISLARGGVGDELIEAEEAEGAEYGGDMAVRKGAGDGEGVAGTDQGLALEEAAEGVDLRLGPVGEIGDGALANLGAVANGLAEEDGGRGVAVGDALHDQMRSTKEELRTKSEAEPGAYTKHPARIVPVLSSIVRVH